MKSWLIKETKKKRIEIYIKNKVTWGDQKTPKEIV